MGPRPAPERLVEPVLTADLDPDVDTDDPDLDTDDPDVDADDRHDAPVDADIDVTSTPGR